MLNSWKHVTFFVLFFEVFVIDKASYFSKKQQSDTSWVTWENTRQREREKQQKGLGEQGQPVVWSGSENELVTASLREYGYNAHSSSKVALNRSLPDVRHRRCRKMQYQAQLPLVSIIIPYFEEHWSTLLRTVLSAIQRASSKLIKEVILVNDASSASITNFSIDDLPIKLNEKKKIRIIRLEKREGLIRAKLAGARNATGEVLVFLDAHCEAQSNWLVPLLQPIVLNYRTVTCPIIDVIDANTLEYRVQDDGSRGGFNWDLTYKRLPRLPSDQPATARPFSNPVMAGGLFAIHKNWFWELGGYDDGLEVWGGEQFELSFKVWMCGGQILDIPCSRVGHIFRRHPKLIPNGNELDFLGRNLKRVAEVWMDEYRSHVYRRHPEYLTIPAGSLQAQHALRARLKCKSFTWFLEHVAFDLLQRYPPIEPDPIANGDLRPLGQPNLCIDLRQTIIASALGSGMKNVATKPYRLQLSPCWRDGLVKQAVQHVRMTYLNDIQFPSDDVCLDLSVRTPRASVDILPCHGNGGNQLWRIEPVGAGGGNPVRIIHIYSRLCLDCDLQADRRTVFASVCRPKQRTQQWIWQKVDLLNRKGFPLKVADV